MDATLIPGQPLSAHSILGPVASGGRLLRNGSSGPDVSLFQQELMGAGYWMPMSTGGGKRRADGIFGAETTLTVQQFQAAQRLTVDGIVGPLTLNSLESFLLARGVPQSLSFLGDSLALIPRVRAARANYRSRFPNLNTGYTNSGAAEHRFRNAVTPFDLAAWRIPNNSLHSKLRFGAGPILANPAVVPLVIPVLEEIVVVTIAAITVAVENHPPLIPPPPIPPPVIVANHIEQALKAAQVLLVVELAELIEQVKAAAAWVEAKLAQCIAQATAKKIKECGFQISNLEYVLWKISQRVGVIWRHHKLKHLIEGLKQLREEMQKELLAVANCLKCDLRKGP